MFTGLSQEMMTSLFEVLIFLKFPRAPSVAFSLAL